MNDLLAAVSNWKPNRWLMAGGFVLMLLSVVSSIAGFEIVEEMRLSAFWAGFVVLMTGAAFAWKLAELQERRDTPRPSAPISDNSIAFAKRVNKPITMNEIDTVPLLPVDEQNDLEITVKRLRLREAARDGSVIYYQDGQYIPRNRNDNTVMG